MSRNVISVIYLVVMIAVVITVDVLFLRGKVDTVPRLFTNIGIVALFGLGYWAFLRRR